MGGFESLLREALLVTAILTLPVLVLATLVGAFVAVLQAATQVQEQTLTLLPKIVVVGPRRSVDQRLVNAFGKCSAVKSALKHLHGVFIRLPPGGVAFAMPRLAKFCDDLDDALEAIDADAPDALHSEHDD